MEETIKNKAKNLQDFLQKTEVSQLLPFADLLEEIRDTLKIIAEKETKIPDFPAPLDTVKTEIVGAEVITIKGEPGKDPTDEHLLELIKPNIPPAIKGDSYILTAKDKKEIAGSITVPIVEKEIETIIEKQPIITNEIKEVAVTDDGSTIIDKINDDESEKKIKAEKVEGLEGLEDRFKQVDKQISSIPHGGGRSNNSTKFYDLSSQTNGSLKVFSVPKNVAAIVLCSDFPTVLMEGNGFTLNTTRTQLTLTVTNAPSSGAQLLFQYSSVFNT